MNSSSRDDLICGLAYLAAQAQSSGDLSAATMLMTVQAVLTAGDSVAERKLFDLITGFAAQTLATWQILSLATGTESRAVS